MCAFVKSAVLKVVWLIAAVALAPLVLTSMLADYIARGETGMEEVRW